MRSLVHGIWLAAAILLPHPANPSCVGPYEFCAKLPERDDRGAAVFVGVVKQIYGPPAPSAARPGGGPPPSGTGENRLRRGSPVPRLEKRYPSVRLQVIESFLGVPLGELVVRITSDLFIDGVPAAGPPFQEGETWLVEAKRDRFEPDVWVTSNCLRTRPVHAAGADLHILRAWAAERTLPARIAGQVWDTVKSRSVAGVRIDLRGNGKRLSTVSDSRGLFAFAGLAAGVYEISAAGAENPVKVDLTSALCARVVLHPSPATEP